MKKIHYITTTEEMVLNPKYAGMRTARIEIAIDGETYPVEVGRITIWDDNELFDQVRDIIESALDKEEKSDR